MISCKQLHNLSFEIIEMASCLESRRDSSFEVSVKKSNQCSIVEAQGMNQYEGTPIKRRLSRLGRSVIFLDILQSVSVNQPLRQIA